MSIASPTNTNTNHAFLRLYRAPHDGPSPPESGDSPPPATPPAGEGRPHAAQTLRQFYEAFVRGRKLAAGRTARTITQDLESIGYWELLTGDPPLARIDAACVQRYVLALARLPRNGRDPSTLAPNTVRKHVVHIQAILDAAGPGSRKRPGARVIDAPPYIERPPVQRTPRHALSIGEIRRILAAAAEAPQPSHLGELPAADFMTALVLAAYWTSMRLGTLLALRWEWLRTDRRDRCWATIPPSGHKTGPRSGRTLEIYVPPRGLEAMESLRGRHGSGIVFPWRGWPATQSCLHDLRRAVWAAAAVDRANCGFHGLRRASLGWLAERNVIVARRQAGHAGGDMLSDHYVPRRIVCRLVDRLPDPLAGRPLKSVGPEQLEMF